MTMKIEGAKVSLLDNACCDYPDRPPFLPDTPDTLAIPGMR